MKAPKAPCKDCEDRHVGCHSECNRYIAWRAEMDRQNKQAQDERAKEYAFYGYYSVRRERARKRAGKRPARREQE